MKAIHVMDASGQQTRRGDTLMLAARVLLMILFLISGVGKLVHFGLTVTQMAHYGLPLPLLAAVIAVIMEVPIAIAFVLGIYTRPLAALLALYTLAAAFIGHHYWTLAGPERLGNMIHFYKNIAIVGGLLQVWGTGGGRYALDRR